jgi:hypothetical protein
MCAERFRAIQKEKWMGTVHRWIGVVCCLSVLTLFALAQTRKAGLWELTTTTIWQQSPSGNAEPSSGVPHTSQFCVTQQYFDKYGAILPPIPGCRLTRLVNKANGMTGEMACTGKMSGTMSLESSWTDGEHATGKVHFVGSMQVGPSSKPIEWRSASSGVYKGTDCGSVKPVPMRDE